MIGSPLKRGIYYFQVRLVDNACKMPKTKKF